MILTPDQNGLWVSTSESHVKHWNLGRADFQRANPNSPEPLLTEPDYVIRGGSSIKQYHILNDKRHILTRDTESNVALYDILKAQKVKDLGPVDFDAEVKQRHQVWSRLHWWLGGFLLNMIHVICR